MKSYTYRCMIVRDSPVPPAKCEAPEALASQAREFLEDFGADILGKEYFGVFYLSARNHVVGREVISVGCLTASLVHPREVFRGALLLPCTGIAVFHNHPSGDPEPSQEDLALTRRLAAAGGILGIEVLDHVILGDKRFVSLKDRGML